MKMFHPNPPVPDKRLWSKTLELGREAGVPIVIENVRGAQYWWGKANYHIGPYYLWADAPPVFNVKPKKKQCVDDILNGVRRNLPVASRFGSHSEKRKQCTAAAAEIPFNLSVQIARAFKPNGFRRALLRK
jgi:hypothetical protein